MQRLLSAFVRRAIGRGARSSQHTERRPFKVFFFLFYFCAYLTPNSVHMVSFQVGAYFNVPVSARTLRMREVTFVYLSQRTHIHAQKEVVFIWLQIVPQVEYTRNNKT